MGLIPITTPPCDGISCFPFFSIHQTSTQEYYNTFNQSQPIQCQLKIIHTKNDDLPALKVTDVFKALPVVESVLRQIDEDLGQ